MEIDFLQFPKIERTRVSTPEARIIARRFDREFFDGDRANGYGGYKYDGRWVPVAKRMIAHYGLKSENPYTYRNGDRVLDVGCGKGFLVKDFRDLGIDARGIDISRYAINEAITEPGICEEGNANKLPFFHKDVDLAVSINTIHNLDLEDCGQALRELMMVAAHQYVVLDSYRTEEEKKRMEDWNLTAKTMLSVDGWLEFFKENGYTGDWSWTIL